jgi:hypothetical protein
LSKIKRRPAESKIPYKKLNCIKKTEA